MIFKIMMISNEFLSFQLFEGARRKKKSRYIIYAVVVRRERERDVTK